DGRARPPPAPRPYWSTVTSTDNRADSAQTPPAPAHAPSVSASSGPADPQSPRVVRPASDIHAVLAEFGSQGTKTTAVIILALGGIFMDAYDFSSLAFGITAIQEQFGLSGFMTGLVNASIMVGA